MLAGIKSRPSSSLSWQGAGPCWPMAWCVGGQGTAGVGGCVYVGRIVLLFAREKAARSQQQWPHVGRFQTGWCVCSAVGVSQAMGTLHATKKNYNIGLGCVSHRN